MTPDQIRAVALDVFPEFETRERKNPDGWSFWLPDAGGGDTPVRIFRALAKSPSSEIKWLRSGDIEQWVGSPEELAGRIRIEIDLYKGTNSKMFEVGKIYNRVNDLHLVYGGQRQGGMSTPSKHPLIFLFSGSSGETHGYRDEFREDGTFWYTGEGQVGDMTFDRANRALRDHAADGKDVHVFEAAGTGLVRYIGQMEYLGHHYEERPDTNGEPRQAIIFELGLVGLAPAKTVDAPSLPTERELRKKSLNELKALAVRGAAGPATATTRRQIVRVRSQAVREYVLRRANGVCEGCGSPAPFRNKQGMPYLEPHHTTRVADGGPDHPNHVIGLCPTCHRRVHNGIDGSEYNDQLIAWLRVNEPEET